MRKREADIASLLVQAGADVLHSTAGNNAMSQWRDKAGSVGVNRRGETDTVMLSEQERSCISRKVCLIKS